MNIGDRKIVSEVKNPNTEILKDDVKPTDIVKNNVKIGALHAIDIKNKKFWNSINSNPDQREKEFKADAVPMLRWMSAVGKPNWNKKDSNNRPSIDDTSLTEYHLIMTNELANVHFWEITDHPELLYEIMFTIGSGTKQDHQWISAGKKDTSSVKLLNLLALEFPFMKMDELQLWVSINTEKDIEQYCKDLGLEDKEIKDFKKIFKELKDRWNG